MEIIEELFKTDISSIIVSVFLVISAIIAMFEIIGKFSIIVGKPVRWIKKKNEDHELLVNTANRLDKLNTQYDKSIEESVKHTEEIKTDMAYISEKMDSLSNQISEMQNKIDETEMAKLKDSIIGYYKKYKEIGEWSKLESAVFWDLFRRYEAHGGNGYVHTIVEPVMREINIL